MLFVLIFSSFNGLQFLMCSIISPTSSYACGTPVGNPGAFVEWGFQWWSSVDHRSLCRSISTRQGWLGWGTYLEEILCRHLPYPSSSLLSPVFLTVRRERHTWGVSSHSAIQVSFSRRGCPFEHGCRQHLSLCGRRSELVILLTFASSLQVSPLRHILSRCPSSPFVIWILLIYTPIWSCRYKPQKMQAYYVEGQRVCSYPKVIRACWKE